MSTLQTIILVIHLVLVVALVFVVLWQRSEGGLGLGGGGVSGFMTGRGSANALTRATAYLAVGFFITSLTLTALANRTGPQRSILELGGSNLPVSQGAQPPAQAGAGNPAAPVGAPAIPETPQIPKSQ